jgi:hypothetical protein
LFLQSLASNASYVSSNVVVMNSNNGGSPLQVLRVKSDGSGLEWANIGTGNVVGPASSTANAIARFDGTTGKLIKDSGVVIDDSGNVGIGRTNPGSSLDIEGTLSIRNASIDFYDPSILIGRIEFGNAIFGITDTQSGRAASLDLSSLTANRTFSFPDGDGTFLVSGVATTDDLTEGTTNLYWTQARFNTAFAGKTTDNLSEGTANLYFTQSRARNSISAQAPVTYNSSTGVIGLNSDQVITHIQINQQTGTSYTLALSDDGKLVQMNNSSANTLTIPNNSSVAFPIGTKIMVQKYGTGNTTIQGASGVTVRDPNSLATISTQYDCRVIFKLNTDEWVVI